MAEYYFKDDDPTPERMGDACWLHQELHNRMEVAVQNGVARAFKPKS